MERRIVFHFSTMAFAKKILFTKSWRSSGYLFGKPRGVFHSVAVEEENSALCRACRHASCGKRFRDPFVSSGKKSLVFPCRMRARVQSRRRPVRRVFRAEAPAAVVFFLRPRRSGAVFLRTLPLALHVRQDGVSIHIYSGRRLRAGESRLCIRPPFMRCFPSYPC